MRHVCCKENLKKNHKKMLTKLQNTSLYHTKSENSAINSY